MPATWLAALGAYSYPVQLPNYKKAPAFAPFFAKNIAGNRATTMQFEEYFRARAANAIQVWYEVVFWKLFSQAAWRQRGTNRVVEFTEHQKAITADILWKALQDFAETPDISKFRMLRCLLGQSYGLAVPLTFVAFACPQQYPMLDKRVALWVNGNRLAHCMNRSHKLVAFKSYNTKTQIYFRDVDFPAYLKWVWWCREVATVLSERTEVVWRARDVEMAVFTADEKNLSLSVLP